MVARGRKPRALSSELGREERAREVLYGSEKREGLVHVVERTVQTVSRISESIATLVAQCDQNAKEQAEHEKRLSVLERDRARIIWFFAKFGISAMIILGIAAFAFLGYLKVIGKF